MKTVIVGSGLAGFSIIRELRKLDQESSITLVAADKAEAYSKPMLSNALSMGKAPDALVQMKASDAAERNNITIKSETVVLEIDRDRKVLQTTTGDVEYDKLVLALGAEPVQFPIAGNGTEDVVTVNHLDDYRKFIPKVEQAKSIAIMGPGLIGSEFANDLVTADKKITVIGPDKWPLSTLIPVEAGEHLQQALEGLGVGFQLETTVSSIDKESGGYSLQLANGDKVQADLVLSAIGLRPIVDLAKEAGLDVERGIVVDKFGQTNDESIFALGDCAQYVDGWMPYIMPIMHAARSLAKTIAGEGTEINFPIMPVTVKTPAAPVTLVRPPEGAQWSFEKNEEGLIGRAELANKLVGFVLLGNAKLRNVLLKEMSA